MIPRTLKISRYHLSSTFASSLPDRLGNPGYDTSVPSSTIIFTKLVAVAGAMIANSDLTRHCILEESYIVWLGRGRSRLAAIRVSKGQCTMQF